MKTHISVIGLILILCTSLSASAQSGRLYDTTDGLSSSFINQVLQDSKGYIWIATQYGLNKYNGISFVRYYHETSEKNSLKNNYVRCLYESSENTIFVGCYNGLMYYDPGTDSFCDIPMIREDEVQSPHVTQILQIHTGEIWIATAGQGLFIYDPEEKIAISHAGIMEQLQIFFLNGLFQDSRQRVWFTTEFNGIASIDLVTQEVHFYRQPLVPENTSISVIETPEGEILAGFLKEGVARYDVETQRFIPVPFDGANKSASVYCMKQVGDEIWIGCDGEGIQKYNAATKKLELSQPNLNTLDYSQGRIHAILEDRNKNIWIGMCLKGLVQITHRDVKFDYTGARSVTHNPIGTNCVTMIYKDKNGHLWVSNDNEGLFEIDKQGNRLKHYHPWSEGGVVPNVIYSVYEDSRGAFWIASPSDPLICFDRNTGESQRIAGLEIDNVTFIAEDKQGDLYFVTKGKGMYRYISATKEIKHYSTSKSENKEIRDRYLANDWINSIMCDNEGLIWLAHYKGISCFNPEDESFVHFTKNNLVIAGSIGYVIMQDEAGYIWAGTSDGLYRFCKKSGEKKLFKQQNGLSNNVICGIAQDEMGYIWISTFAGISRLTPETQTFINYSVKDGLQNNEFYPGAFYCDKGEYIYFGGINGITSFNPLNIVGEEYNYQVEITEFSIYQQPVNVHTQSGKHQVVDKPVSEADHFTLSHNDNTFSLSFATLTYVNTEQIYYYYRIKELGGTWIATDPGQNKVTYNNIPPGQYTFEIFAASTNASPAIKSLKIQITPPWYQSSVAYFIYLLAIIAVIIAIIYYFRDRMKRKQRRIERRYKAEMNDAKLQFFINISHEIRTPMTLIMGPLEKLLKSDAAKEVMRTYQLIYRNAHRILNLMNQLMDLHKLDKGQMQAHFEEVNLNEFVSDVMQSFEYMAQRRDINLTVDSDTPEIKAWIDAEHFDKILLNILSNAFKYTPDGGSIIIGLSRGYNKSLKGPLQQYIELTITDNGIGIEEDKIEEIFGCFYRIDNQVTQSSTGTGIGLYLSRLLLDLHHGTIHAENNKGGSGSRFILRIPEGKAHLTSEELHTTILPPIKDGKLSSNIVNQMVPEDGERKSIKAKSRKTIMIAEDDKEICEYLRSELSAQYKILTYHNGKDACDALLNSSPDLLISDIMMPGMDGLELCAKIRSNMLVNDLPVILLTARASVEDRISGIDHGADCYLPKPFHMEVLKSTIQNLLQKRHMLQTKYNGSQTQTERLQSIEMKTPDERLMERIMKVINENLANPELNVEMLASEVGLSRVHVHRKMKQLTNLSTRDFIRNIRLRQAAILLQEKKLGISDVAYATGFSTLSYFSTQFKETYGVSPKEYLQLHHDSLPEPANSQGPY